MTDRNVTALRSLVEEWRRTQPPEQLAEWLAGKGVHAPSAGLDAGSEPEDAGLDAALAGLQEQQARYAAIVTSSTDAIISKTLEGVITSWNPAAERIFGYGRDEMVGTSVFRLIPEELHESERDILRRLRHGERVGVSETERVRKDGRRIWISLSVSPVRDKTGAIIGAASIKRDVTEQRLATQQLRETQRFQAVGQLAGGMAHEANNQMLVVLGAVHFLLRQGLPARARDDLEQIRLAAERTASITRQLLAFGRRQFMQFKDVDLKELVQSFAPILRRSLKEEHELVLDLQPAGLMRADPRQLEQVLLNLALNARDAMPEGGTLAIATTRVGPSECPVPLAANGGGTLLGCAELTVEDTGQGMDDATLQRAFEPFYTTKDVGEGSGLGLSVVEGIVKQSSGHLGVTSAVGQGTRFTLHFPLLSAGVSAPSAGVPGPSSTGAGRVVLVVEDEAPVRDMACRSLLDAGYVVLAASNGQEALDLLRQRNSTVDLVLADVGMPVMNGRILGQHVHDEFRGTSVLYISGYGEVDVKPLLQKPFAPDELVRAVGDLLDQQARV